MPSDAGSLVSEESYARLLGYPPRRLIEGRAERLATECRRWFAREGRPLAMVSRREDLSIEGETVRVADRTFHSQVLAERLLEAEASSWHVALVSAGVEIDRESSLRWSQERPDEAYFLDRFGAAVAIQLAAWAADRLRQEHADDGSALLPGYSPGYEGWPLEQQLQLAQSLGATDLSGVAVLDPEVRVHPSGMIEPRNSLLGAFGVATRSEVAERLWRVHPCSWCSRAGCSLRGNSPAPAPGERIAR